MAWTFNGTGSQTLIADGSHLDIPNDDWSFTGWFRVSDNSDSNYKRIIGWGTMGGTPHVQVFLPGTGLGASNNDHVSARVLDSSANDSGVLYSPSFDVSSHYDEWIAWTLSHNSANNYTVLRVLDRANGNYYSNGAAHNCGSINIAQGFYIGAEQSGNNATRFVGDLAEFAYLPGTFMDINTFHGFVHGGRAFRFPDCEWNIPMLGDRADEEWIAQHSVTSTNVATTVYDGPQLQQVNSRLYLPLDTEVAGTAATQGLKIAQLYGQVVKQPAQTGNLEVRRMWAEVLISGTSETSTFNESVNSVMTLNQSVGLIRAFNVSASNTMNLQGTANGAFDRQEIEHTLNLTGSASAVRDRPFSLSHTISFVSLGGRTLTLEVSQNLGITSTQNEFNYVADRQPVGNTLNFSQLVEYVGGRDVTHDLGLTHSVSVQYPHRESITHPLNLVSRTSTPWRLWVEDDITLRQKINLVLPTQHVTSTLNFVQDSPIGRTLSTLNFTQTVTFAFSLTASNNLGITDSVDVEGLWVRSVTHNNFLGHSLTWYEDSPCDRKNYTPFQGENTIPAASTSYTPPRTTLQDPQGDTGNFSLYTPYLGLATNKVTLRKPELDNRDRNAYTRVNSETRGGKLIVYSDPKWPHVRTLAVTIVGLTEAQVDEFHDFMEDTLGQEIGLTDWEGRLWKGVITNPNEAATQDGKSRWTVTFEFEGEMLDVEQPEYNNGSGQPMNLSQSVTAVIV